MIAQIAPILTALTALLTLMGTGLAWLWRANAARFRAIEAKLEKCERHERRTDRKFRIVSTGLAMAVDRIDPADPIIPRLGKLLRRHFKIDPDLPSDWAGVLTALDAIEDEPEERKCA